MNFQYELVKVSGEQALNTYEALKNSADVIPVILGDEDDFAMLTESMEYVTESIEQLLEQAEDMDALEWFEKRQAQDSDYYDLTHGEWHIHVPTTHLSAHLDILTGEPKAEIYIALVPTTDAWKIPAYLKIGGWNDCPTAAEHAAIFKYWQHHYGAKVACIAGDVIEMEVERPPKTKEDALKLAEQQFIYCPDIVYQGTETIAALASTLLNGSAWFFWWD